MFPLTPRPMYETVNASLIVRNGTGDLPVPPQELRERLRFPERYRYECLHPSRAEEYNLEYREAALTYLKQFASHHRFGYGPLFAGPARTGTSRIAAALANEIILRYGPPRADLSAAWLSGFWMLRMILDAKDLGQKEYYSTLRNQMFQISLVVVDDLLSAVEHPGGRALIQTVYAYRWDHQLPTITTVTTPEAGADVGKLIEKAYGKTFKERLALSSRGLYTAL